MRARSLFFILLLIAAAGGGYWYLRASPDGAAPASVPFAQPAVPVETVLAETRRLTLSIPAVGTLRSNESITVSPEIAGRIVALHAEEGVAIAAGEPIVTLDQSIYEATIQEVQARISLSEANYERARELLARQAGTQRALDEADAQLKADRADLALARAVIDKTVIRAPFDGVLGLRRVSVGQYVESGDVIVNLESIDPLKVDFRIPEVHFTRTYIGQEIAVTVDAIGGEIVNGRVFAIDPLVDESGRSLVLRAQIPNDDGKLRPGLFARIDLIYDVIDEALMVPEAAIVPLGQRNYVYVIDGDFARFVPVELGQRVRGSVEIVGGIEEGAEIVTAGQLRLFDGAEVQIVGGSDG
ncbi:MAG: efflux RND transporter periplasmic adaptor subunit [Dongiaceae bacterium]